MQLDSAGSRQWTFQTGTTGDDYVRGLGIGPLQEIILGGATSSAWGRCCSRGELDLFVMELSSTDGSPTVQKVFQTGSSSEDELPGEWVKYRDMKLANLFYQHVLF